MKEGWEYKTLGEIAKVFAGGDVPKNRMSKCKKEPFIIPIYTNGIENEGLYGYTDIARVNDLSLTISARGTIGAIFKRNNPFFPAIRLITVCPQNIVDINFLYYVLLNSTFTKSGTTIPQLTVPMLKQYRFAIPENISIQQNIANYLDSSFKLIDEIKNKALKSLTEAKALFQSALAEAMEPKEGWEKKTLGEIAEIKGGKRVPKGYKLLTEPTNHKYIRVADFNDFGSITLENIQYISDEVYNQIKRYTISSKDVYISIAGTIGKSGIIPKEREGANLTENACKLVLDSCAYKYFVYYFTKSALFLNQIKKLTMISAQPKLALTRLATVNIPLPNLSTQKQIVSHLDKLSSKVRAMEEKYQKMVEECDALKQAMLRDVFE